MNVEGWSVRKELQRRVQNVRRPSSHHIADSGSLGLFFVLFVLIGLVWLFCFVFLKTRNKNLSYY